MDNILIKRSLPQAITRKPEQIDHFTRLNFKKKNYILRTLYGSTASSVFANSYRFLWQPTTIICSNYVMLSYFMLENTRECIRAFAKFTRFLSNKTADWSLTDCSHYASTYYVSLYTCLSLRKSCGFRNVSSRICNASAGDLETRCRNTLEHVETGWYSRSQVTFIVSIRKPNLNENTEGNDHDKLILRNRNNGIKIKRTVSKLSRLFE